MNRARTLLLVVGAWLSGVPVVDAEPGPADDSVLDFVARYEAALAMKNFDDVAPLIHPDAVFRFSEGDHRGLDAIRSAFEQTWSADVADDQYQISDRRVLWRTPASATVLFSWAWSGNSTEHGSFRIDGRGTLVIVRDEAGYRIVLEHLSR